MTLKSQSHDTLIVTDEHDPWAGNIMRPDFEAIMARIAKRRDEVFREHGRLPSTAEMIREERGEIVDVDDDR